MLRGTGLLLIIIVGGTIGYSIIKGWSFLDSMYMTITTITTVGYNEVHPLPTSEQIFSIILILSGVGIAFYILTALLQYLLEEDLESG